MPAKAKARPAPAADIPDFDLEAADIPDFDLEALNVEATAAPYKFKAAGKIWTLPHYGTIGWEILEHFDDEGIVFAQVVIKIGLGDQYEDFKAATGGRSVQWMSEVVSAWIRASGVAPGESAASSDS